MSCLQLLTSGSATGPAAKEKCDRLAPLIMRSFALSPPATPPNGVPAAPFVALLEDLANVQIRLLGIIVYLSPPRGMLMETNDPALVDHLIRLLHNTPVSAANAKDLLVYGRHILAKFRKLPADDPAAKHICSRVLALVGGGALFTRQRVLSQRSLAHTLVSELVLSVIKQLPLETLDELLDVFAVELLDTRLGVQVL